MAADATRHVEAAGRHGAFGSVSCRFTLPWRAQRKQVLRADHDQQLQQVAPIGALDSASVPSLMPSHPPPGLASRLPDQAYPPGHKTPPAPEPAVTPGGKPSPCSQHIAMPLSNSMASKPRPCNSLAAHPGPGTYLKLVCCCVLFSRRC